MSSGNFDLKEETIEARPSTIGGLPANKQNEAVAADQPAQYSIQLLLTPELGSLSTQVEWFPAPNAHRNVNSPCLRFPVA